MDRQALFEAKVSPEPNSGCHIWLGGIGSHGYGNFNAGDHRFVLAHRWAYEVAKGPIPDGLEVDHLCRNKLCVNPAHLEAVSGKVNTQRWAETITHCRRGGHLLSPENVYMHNGGRECRTCNRERQQERRARVGANVSGPAD